MYLTTKNKPDSKPIAINTETREVIRIAENNTGDKEQREDPFDYLDENEIRKFKKKMSILEINLLKNAFKSNIPPTDPFLKSIYDVLKPVLENKEQRELKTHLGGYMVIPKKGKNQIIYVAGQTGSGKSTWISKYLEEYRKVYQERKIFLFSDVDSDSALDKHGVLRIKLNEKLVLNPIKTHELSNTLVIFDDIDSISNKDLKNCVLSLYDSILKKGSSHDFIDLIVTSHAIADYRNTRNLLINTHYIVWFRGGLNVDYVLRKLGLNRDQIYKLMNINSSRWVALHKNYPTFYVSEKEIGII